MEKMMAAIKAKRRKPRLAYEYATKRISVRHKRHLSMCCGASHHADRAPTEWLPRDMITCAKCLDWTLGFYSRNPKIGKASGLMREVTA